MDITASIVTYNSGPVIGTCLEHLVKATSRPLEIIVADNLSRDDTVAQLTPWQKRVRVIINAENLGFGRAHNAALSTATGRYFLILNPDIELPLGALDLLSEYLDQHSECGAVAPLLDEGDGHIPGRTLTYPGQRYAGLTFASLPGQIAALQGACLMVRASVYRAIGGFDPGFFLYAEDLDLSLEIRKQRYELHCLDSLVVRHLGGHSERSFQPQAVSAKKHLGLLLFYRKHYPRWARAFLITRDCLKSVFRLLALSFARSPHGVARRDEYRGRLQAIAAYFRGANRL
jgi:GT2 family glycosyltransferase